MKAALMQTINDFQAYEIVTGWSMHKKLACQYCMENNKTFTLTIYDKISFSDCHQRFLPTYHKFRKNKKKTSLLADLKGMLHCHFFDGNLNSIFGMATGKYVANFRALIE